MIYYSIVILVLLVAAKEVCLEKYREAPCPVRARIHSGWICGTRRLADDGSEYASFRGIPYAKQPLGELRFQELQPVIPWKHYLDTTEQGPICPQHDEVYGLLIKPLKGMSEACIYANVHVPIIDLQALYAESLDKPHMNGKGRYTSGLPILVYIHGGAFQAGSGDSDVNGPEYLVSHGVIVITFNYRINIFGFLSLNSPEIPGNQGLRDQVTLLRWVQRNAQAFGGDPDNVTLIGHSAGATCAHLLSLSKATSGLFQRVILMSGIANSGFYTTSPLYAQLVTTMLLSRLGINSTDPAYIHDQLVRMPLERILVANSAIQYALFLISFSPVVEASHPGVTRIVDDDPVELIKTGRGNQYPLIVGFTSAECEFFRPRIVYLETLRRIRANPMMSLSLQTVFKTPPDVSLQLARRIIQRYFNGNISYDLFMKSCTEANFMYPALQLSELRATRGGAPVYLYQYAYESEFNVLKLAGYLDYKGSAHGEDLIKVFRVNSIPGELPLKDSMMIDWMRKFILNFVRCSNPSCAAYEETSPWPAVHGDLLNYQLVAEPCVYMNRQPTPDEWDTKHFFDCLNMDAKRGASESALSANGSAVAALLANITAIAHLEIRPPYDLAITYESIKI